MSMTKSLEDVRTFWDAHPLFCGESPYTPGTPDFFDDFRKNYIGDCLAGSLDDRVLPAGHARDRGLDLGCGPGFWTVELARRGCPSIVAADLSPQSLELAKRYCAYHKVQAEFRVENAERLSFRDGEFSHVNCQGVIHHTPDTEACVREIARVLRPGGTASLSLYRKNLLLTAWPALSFLGKPLARLGIGLKGRGRETLCEINDPDEIVRSFDGTGNPIGKCYTRRQIIALFSPYFAITAMYVHFFPVRMFPFRVPSSVHRWLDRTMGFLQYINIKKRP